MSTALNLTGYAKYFDKPFPGTGGAWANAALQGAFTASSLYSAYGTCVYQYSELASDNWPVDFEIVSAFATNEPEVSAGFSDVGDYLQAATILLNINGAMNSYNSHFYYFTLGKNIGYSIGYTFTGFDDWFGLGIITKTDPWDRYTAP